jgi:RNA polymerase sigma-70 factor (sigma-E family)
MVRKMQKMANQGVAVVSVVQQRSESRDADFSAYMAARQPALLRTAYLLTGDRHGAEDLVQQTLAKLYVAWSKVQAQESIDGYARRIMINEHNSLWRRAWKRREVVTETIPERGPEGGPDRSGGYPGAQDGPAYDDGTRSALWAFVQTLPRKQRAVVVLRYYEELSEAETADVLGISVGTVKSQASRALAALRERAPQTLNPRHEGGN